MIWPPTSSQSMYNVSLVHRLQCAVVVQPLRKAGQLSWDELRTQTDLLL